MLTKQESIKLMESFLKEFDERIILKYINRIDNMSEEEWKHFQEEKNINNIQDLENLAQKVLRQRETTTFIALNDWIEYGCTGDTLHIHVIPKDIRFLMNRRGLEDAEMSLIEALEKISELLKNHEEFKEIKQVYAVSGLIRRPISKLFENLDFDIKSMRIDKVNADDELKNFYEKFKDKKYLGRAKLSKEKLLSEEWNKLKDERKLQLIHRDNHIIEKEDKEISIKINLSEIESFEKIGSGKCANIYRKDNEAYKILKQKSDSRKFYSARKCWKN